MRKLCLVFVILVVSGCGKKRPPVEVWPAYLNSFDGFSEEQKSRFSTYVNTLNTKAGKTVISLTPVAEGYPIHVRLSPPPTSNLNQAGLATRSEEGCAIEISTQLFEKYREDYQQSVFLHELGHCAGLGHVKTLGSVMYPVAQPFASYTTTAVEDFMKSFLGLLPI